MASFNKNSDQKQTRSSGGQPDRSFGSDQQKEKMRPTGDRPSRTVDIATDEDIDTDDLSSERSSSSSKSSGARR